MRKYPARGNSLRYVQEFSRRIVQGSVMEISGRLMFHREMFEGMFRLKCLGF